MYSTRLVVVIFSLVFVACAKPDCPPSCDDSACVPADNCLAGLVKDNCNCCYVCGASEGNRCHHQEVPGSQIYNKCGKDLECKVRTDLERGDIPEAVCYCTKDDPICGSDGKIYRNMCEFTEVRYATRTLTLGNWETCQYAPMILQPPTDLNEKKGKNVAFSCEATGWPIPKFEWQFVPHNQANAGLLPLPSDNSHYSVQNTGGPRSKEATSWLQILAVNASNQGTYHCIASNENGQVTASAKLRVL